MPPSRSVTGTCLRQAPYVERVNDTAMTEAEWIQSAFPEEPDWWPARSWA